MIFLKRIRIKKAWCQQALTQATGNSTEKAQRTDLVLIASYEKECAIATPVCILEKLKKDNSTKRSQPSHSNQSPKTET
jgi:hypothetical protein